MRLLPAAVLTLALFGCPEKRQAPMAEAPKAEAPLNLDKPDQARIQLDLAAARAALLKHQQINGANPQTLAELGVKLFHPSDIIYDPATGTVNSRTYPQF
jgi:hypothetical protein